MILPLILSAGAGILLASFQVYYKNRKEKRLINKWDSCNDNLDILIKEINKKAVEDKLSPEIYVLLHKYESRSQYAELNLGRSYVNYEPNKAFVDYTRKNCEFYNEYAINGFSTIGQ